MSTILERAILEQVPGAIHAHVEGEYVFVDFGAETITRFRLSREAQRIALLEREGRPLDMTPGTVLLLPPGESDDLGPHAP